LTFGNSAWAALACLITLGCALAVYRRARALARFRAPSLDAELATVREASSETRELRRAQALAEINDSVLDVDASTAPDPQFFQALGRVSLASGTACALLTLAGGLSFAVLPSAGVAFVAGVVGVVATRHFGLLAERRAKAVRAEFREHVRRTRGQLTSSTTQK